MLFTVKGATAGAILMEWNIHAHMQGSGKSPLPTHQPGPKISVLLSKSATVFLFFLPNKNSGDVGLPFPCWRFRRFRLAALRLPQIIRLCKPQMQSRFDALTPHVEIVRLF